MPAGSLCIDKERSNSPSRARNFRFASTERKMSLFHYSSMQNATPQLSMASLKDRQIRPDAQMVTQPSSNYFSVDQDTREALYMLMESVAFDTPGKFVYKVPAWPEGRSVTKETVSELETLAGISAENTISTGRRVTSDQKDLLIFLRGIRKYRNVAGFLRPDGGHEMEELHQALERLYGAVGRLQSEPTRQALLRAVMALLITKFKAN